MMLSKEQCEEESIVWGHWNRVVEELVERAVEFDIFSETEGRGYNCFCDSQRGRPKVFNASVLYSWIIKHKKNATRGIRAR